MKRMQFIIYQYHTYYYNAQVFAFNVLSLLHRGSTTRNVLLALSVPPCLSRVKSSLAVSN